MHVSILPTVQQMFTKTLLWTRPTVGATRAKANQMVSGPEGDRTAVTSSHCGVMDSPPLPSVINSNDEDHNVHIGDGSQLPEVYSVERLTDSVSFKPCDSPACWVCPHYTDKASKTQRKLSKSMVELGFKLSHCEPGVHMLSLHTPYLRAPSLPPPARPVPSSAQGLQSPSQPIACVLTPRCAISSQHSLTAQAAASSAALSLSRGLTNEEDWLSFSCHHKPSVLITGSHQGKAYVPLSKSLRSASSAQMAPEAQVQAKL